MDVRVARHEAGDEAITRIRELAAARPHDALNVARTEARLHPQNRKLALVRARLERRNGNFREAFRAYNALRRASGQITAETTKVLFELLVRRYKFRAARRLYDYA